MECLVHTQGIASHQWCSAAAGGDTGGAAEAVRVSSEAFLCPHSVECLVHTQGDMCSAAAGCDSGGAAEALFKSMASDAVQCSHSVEYLIHAG